MCHCHLLPAVVEIDKVGKDEDAIKSMTIDVPLSLTLCSGRDRQSVVGK